MDPLTALQPLQGGFGYSFQGYGSFGPALSRAGCCQPQTACCPTTGADPNQAMQKSLRQIEKSTARLLKLLMRLMEGKKAKKKD